MSKNSQYAIGLVVAFGALVFCFYGTPSLAQGSCPAGQSHSNSNNTEVTVSTVRPRRIAVYAEAAIRVHGSSSSVSVTSFVNGEQCGYNQQPGSGTTTPAIATCTKSVGRGSHIVRARQNHSNATTLYTKLCVSFAD